MKIDEVTPVLDVHPPHEPLHGWRDFAIHLFTITIGLLIALSLEGRVEWQHHRHLVSDAEESLHTEIAGNAKGMQATLDALHKQQGDLTHDVAVLKLLLKTHKMPPDAHMSVAYGIRTFDNVSWKTAQTTGALSYMPYDRAQEYAQIYSMQDLLTGAEQQAARDAILSVAPFADEADNDPDPSPEQATEIMQKIQVLQGQVALVDSILKALDGDYKEFLAAHPG